MKKYIQKLRTDAWRTGGARYNAGRRLKRRDLFATLSLSLFSATGVSLAVVQRKLSYPRQSRGFISISPSKGQKRDAPKGAGSHA